jgi:hypothetical protein
MLIYHDEKRTMTREGDTLVIRNARGEKHVCLSSAIRDPEPREIAALRQAGYDPAGWFVLCVPRSTDRQGRRFGGAALAILPPESRQAIAAALATYAAEIETARNDPANRERRRIDALYAQARRAYENGEWDRSFSLEHDAAAALARWRVAFPAQAGAERRGELIAQAEELESRAVGALVYDADGSLTPAMQEERAAQLRRRAAELRVRAGEE